MKRCVQCGFRFTTDGWQCSSCGTEPQLLEGFPSFAVALAHQSEGFDPRHFEELARLEARNFWFRARNRLIVWALGRYFRGARSFLEIGCGTGYVLSGIARAFPKLRVAGSEIYSKGLGFAARRVRRAELFQADARHIPFESEFDVIGAFDVVEHIKEDEAVLAELYRAVAPGGGIILSVPQHAFLWSQQDVHACHVRRYDPGQLERKVRAAGFIVERSTSFVTLLMPLLMLSRMGKQEPSESFDALEELRIGPFLNTALEAVMALERLIIRAGLSLPFGGSRLIVARKGRINPYPPRFD
jgi:SAM-dependent methyltransferase